MLLTQLEYFVAVARERHFGRAAAECFVSPSTLSEAIRKLETELGVPLVQRGRTFEGLTREGELVLAHAQRMLADHRALSSDLSAARERLAARMRIGVIPSGVVFAASIVSALGARNPLVRASMTTGMTSEEIVAGLRSYELDAGVIHPSAADGDDLLTIPLHEDRAVLVTGTGFEMPAPSGPDPESTAIPAARLAELPLCLLEPHMRARQIFDEAMHGAGLDVVPRFEADSVEALLLLARTGPWAAVVPESAVRRLGADGGAGGTANSSSTGSAAGSSTADGLRVLRIADPELSFPIVLARLADEPTSALASAIDEAAHRSLRG